MKTKETLSPALERVQLDVAIALYAANDISAADAIAKAREFVRAWENRNRSNGK